MWIKRHIVLFIVTNFKIWVYIKIMWIKRHIVLFIATNMGIHRNYVSFYSHSSFFIVTNYQIHVYKGIKIYFLLVTLKLPQIDFFEI